MIKDDFELRMYRKRYQKAQTYGLNISEIKELILQKLDLIETERLFQPLQSIKNEELFTYDVAINLFIELLDNDFKKLVD